MNISTHRANGALRVSKKYLERKSLEGEGGFKVKRRGLKANASFNVRFRSPSLPSFANRRPAISTKTRLMPVSFFGSLCSEGCRNQQGNLVELALNSQDVGRWAVADAVVVGGGTANSCSGWSRSPQSNGHVEERSKLRPGKNGSARLTNAAGTRKGPHKRENWVRRAMERRKGSDELRWCPCGETLF